MIRVSRKNGSWKNGPPQCFHHLASLHESRKHCLTAVWPVWAACPAGFQEARGKEPVENPPGDSVAPCLEGDHHKAVPHPSPKFWWAQDFDLDPPWGSSCRLLCRTIKLRGRSLEVEQPTTHIVCRLDSAWVPSRSARDTRSWYCAVCFWCLKPHGLTVCLRVDIIRYVGSQVTGVGSNTCGPVSRSTAAVGMLPSWTSSAQPKLYCSAAQKGTSQLVWNIILFVLELIPWRGREISTNTQYKSS